MTAGSTSGYFKRNGLSFGGGGICYEIRFNIKLYDIKILVCVLEVMETPERMQGTSATAAAPFATIGAPSGNPSNADRIDRIRSLEKELAALKEEH